MANSEPTGRTLLGLLAVGVGVWILASIAYVAWFFAANDGAGLGAVAAPFIAWAFGYLPGGLALVVYAAARVLRRRLSATVAVWAVLVYFLPVLLNGVVVGGLLALIPQTAVESDLGGMVASLSGPWLVLLYLVGLGLGLARRRGPLRRAIVGVVGPPLAGTMLIGGWLGWTALSSPEFLHGGAFAFTVQEAVASPAGLRVDATLEVKREGDWNYHALYLEVTGGSAGGRADEIRWLDGPPGKPGVYRVRLLFNGLQPHARAGKREVFFEIRERRPGQHYDPPVVEFRVPVKPRILPEGWRETRAGRAA